MRIVHDSFNSPRRIPSETVPTVYTMCPAYVVAYTVRELCAFTPLLFFFLSYSVRRRQLALVSVRVSSDVAGSRCFRSHGGVADIAAHCERRALSATHDRFPRAGRLRFARRRDRDYGLRTRKTDTEIASTAGRYARIIIGPSAGKTTG